MTILQRLSRHLPFGWCLPEPARTGAWAVVFCLALAGCSGGTLPPYGTATPVSPGQDIRPGLIVFGNDVDQNANVLGRKRAFGKADNIAWVAATTQEIQNTHLQIVILRESHDTDTQVHSETQYVGPGYVNLFSNEIDPLFRSSYGVSQPGTYVVEYINKGQILAQGQFIIKP